MDKDKLLEKIEDLIQIYGGDRYGYGNEASLQNEAYNKACRDIQKIIKEDITHGM